MQQSSWNVPISVIHRAFAIAAEPSGPDWTVCININSTP